METIKEVIKDAISKARQMNADNKTPSDVSVEKLENETIDKIIHFINNRMIKAQNAVITEFEKMRGDVM